MAARLPGGYKAKNSTTSHTSIPPNKTSQVRAAKHREQIKQRQTNYKAGLLQKRTQEMPSADDLRKTCFQEQRSSDCDKKATLRDHFNMATEIVSARQQQKKLAKCMMDQLKIGGVGSVPEEKNEATARFIFENYNSLAPWKGLSRYHRLNSLIKQFDADFALGVELQVQWQECDPSLRLEKHLTPGRPKRVQYGYNEHENFGRCQYGGTSVATIGKLAQFVKDAGNDPHHLGRWSWIKVSCGSVSTRVVSAYLPCNSKAPSHSQATTNTKKKRRQTVYNQHRRYFRSIGDKRCPRTIFVDHIALQIKQWKSSGENVLLFVDANSDVYDGILAKALASDDINMKEVCKEILGQKSPNSHVDGTLPITGIFATSGLLCKNVFQSAHMYGIGDHRLFALDVDLASLVGSELPKLVRQPGRRLQATSYKSSKLYCRSFRKNILHHKLTNKYNSLREHHASLTVQEKHQSINSLDHQKEEFMRCGEKNCKKIFVGPLPHSALVSRWTDRKELFEWMLKHKEKPLKDPRNLFRKCRVLAKVDPSFPIKQPRDYTIKEVKAQIVTIKERIDGLAQIAPELRDQFLRDKKNNAEIAGLHRKARGIANILRNEHNRGRFRTMKSTTSKKKGGGAVYAVERKSADGSVELFATKEDIEAVAGQTIEQRYKLAYSAPIMSNNKLLSDIGFTGDGDAVEAILTGTYEFPPNTDPHTQLLLTESAVLFSSIGEDMIEDWVHRQDFQKWWLTAREATESSKSLLHFSHYKVAARDKIISELHAVSLNTIREIGIAPDRWHQSITVLLEKVFGVRLIDKLRAICLLEADFNWLNKLIFAHRLEQHCRKHGLVPHEQFAKSRTTSQEASLVKNLETDNGRILHNSMSITSADMDQCYDRANGSIAGVAARAHGVSKQSTTLMLTTMQHMQYFVKSGFGLADTPSFQGTPDSKLMGLGQGSGAAPLGMRGVVTLAINAYKTLGHGMQVPFSRSQRLLYLAAIIYVDDTDLLHWGKFYGIEDTEFLTDVQDAINDWGKLIQATGGSIKQAKSFYYVMSWKFVQGKPTLKKLAELPKQLLTVPQPDGSSVPIPIRENDESGLTLGVWNNPNNDGVAPLESMLDKGLEWVDSLQAKPLERGLTWLSLKCQKHPQWSYGLSSNYSSPQQLDNTMGRVYYRALPHLGFNRNITKAFRTLPTKFQGIGLRKWSIEKLAMDITTLVRHWRTDSTLGQALEQVYESFQMEVGLDGNILTRSYKQLQELASHSWFKVLWQYTAQYKVKIEFHKQFLIPPTRRGDVALMELFIKLDYSTDQLVRLNRVRKFHRVHSLADILSADGKTVEPAVLTTRQRHSTRTFSWEQPTKADFTLWRTAIRAITSSSLTYSSPLGEYLEEPHITFEWFASDDESLLYHVFPNSSGYDIFARDTIMRRTRTGQRFTKISTSPGSPPCTKYASIRNYESNSVILHSTTKTFQQHTDTTSLINQLQSLRNHSLLDNLQIDGDGEWLVPALLNGSLIICNDGSYMPKLSKEACSGAFILHCQDTKQEIKGCFVDHSPNSDNYRGELLGGVGSLLVLKTALSNHHSLSQATARLRLLSQSILCDNKGVISHGNEPSTALRSEQAQADLIRLLKSYALDLPCKIEWVHVKGHADDNIPFELLTLPQQLNVRCDKLAKKHLIDTIADGNYIDPVFPDENITVHINTAKVSSSVKKAIYQHWGPQEAKNLFSKRNKVTRTAFDLIHWDQMDKIMSSFPETFQGWVTRHISDFNGCNRYQSRWNKTIKNKCPSCNKPNEDTEHITRCTDPTRTFLYNEGVQELQEWLQQNHTPHDITTLYTAYLLGRGNSTMASQVSESSPLYAIAKIQDSIGFDNLLVGRLPKALLTHISPHHNSLNRRGVSPEIWAKKFSTQLILFTHKQWTHRNGVVHYKPSENMTVSEHQAIDDHLQALISLSPTALPPHHRHLLLNEDFRELGAGSSTAKLFWIADVQSALAEAAINDKLQNLRPKRTKIKKKLPNGQNTIVSNINSTLIAPFHPTELGLKWKKRRQK
jgi:hypothetical protein